MSQLNLWILAFSTNFCPIKTDLSGNTVWPQASCFQKLAKMNNFWPFKLTFVHSKRNRSSLRSQLLNETFLWFSNTLCLVCLPLWLWYPKKIFESRWSLTWYGFLAPSVSTRSELTYFRINVITRHFFAVCFHLYCVLNVSTYGVRCADTMSCNFSGQFPFGGLEESENRSRLLFIERSWDVALRWWAFSLYATTASTARDSS